MELILRKGLSFIQTARWRIQTWREGKPWKGVFFDIPEAGLAKRSEYRDGELVKGPDVVSAALIP